MKKHLFRLISLRSENSILQNLIKRYFSHNVGRSAAALAYYLIFSIFPFLILLSSILSFLDLPLLTEENLKGIVPVDVIDIANSYLSHISEIKNASLLFFGFVFTIYFTMRAVNCLLESIHRAYRVTTRYPFWRHQLHILLSTLFLIVIIFFALAVVTLGQTVLTWLSGWIPMEKSSIHIWNMLRFVCLAAVLFAVLLLMYYLVPHRRYSIRQVLPGTLVALLSWLVFSIGFAFYVENMGRYSVVYGSIGAVIVLLLWLYFSAITIIMGAELNFLLANRIQKASKQTKEGFAKGSSRKA